MHWQLWCGYMNVGGVPTRYIERFAEELELV